MPRHIFSQLASLPPDQLWLAGAVTGFAILAAMGLRNPHLVRVGLRNVPRRWGRTALIVFGLMFSTMFVASSLMVDDTITLAVQSVAVFNLGRIDEDVVGYSDGLGLYSSTYGPVVTQALNGDPHVAGVAPSLSVQNLFLADTATRQVRSSVTGLGMDPNEAGPLGQLRDQSGAAASMQALASNEIYLNRNAGALLFAHPGDTIWLSAPQWQGKRYTFRVRAIVTGGPLGDAPEVVLPLTVLQQMVNAPDQINHIYIANAGNGLTGVGYSDEIADRVRGAVLGDLHVDQVKLDGVNFSLKAQDIFSRILTLYTSFALSIGLLLIFLIFVLLAAERRSELGMTRAIGMRQNHVVFMLLFEGAAYDAFAAALGILAGLSLGALIVALVSPTVARIGFPLSIALKPESMIIAFSLGFLFTLSAIWFAAWSVSHMTVAAALRDLPEPLAAPPSLLHYAQACVTAIVKGPLALLAGVGRLIGALVTRGPILLIAGLWIFQQALRSQDILWLSLGCSSIITGVVLLARSAVLAVVGYSAQHRDPGGLLISRTYVIADRLTSLVVGAALVLFWALPFDVLARFGVSRFSGGIVVFFIAGSMMVFGAVLAITPNLDILLAPARVVMTWLSRVRHVTSVALVYPVHHRLRTGIGLLMFTLVCFTMVVMATIANSATHQYDNLPAQAADYDIAGQPLFSPIGGIGQLQKHLAGENNNIAALSSATPLLMGMFEPADGNARWHLYPASEIQGAFLDGVGLPLVARANGFTSDAAVWQAVRDHPGDVVIDVGALSGQDAAILAAKQPAEVSEAQFLSPPIVAGLPGFTTVPVDVGSSSDPNSAPTFGQDFAAAAAFINAGQFDATLHLHNIAEGPGAIAPTAVWVGDLRGGPAVKLTIVGIVENARGQRYGMLGSPATFAPVEGNLSPFGGEYYYFKLKPGVDAHQEAQRIGSDLFDASFETTVLQDVLLDTNGPRVFISRVLVGLVGLTLLVGMAALAVTGSRAVIERRQQIGMLRALGFRRAHVQLVFLIESALIGAVGTALGLVLGLILCYNVFAVDFFAPIQSGMVLIVPWDQLAIICAAALLAATLAALLPAWQAGRVAPADALRYE